MRQTSLRPSRAETTGPYGGVEVLVHVRLAPTTLPAMFERYLHSEPGVLHVWHTAGDIDFEIHLHCQGISDLHDLLTLATSVHACSMALLQAAREARDADLEKACRACDAETLRQISWLETKLRRAAPQALTVPVSTTQQLGASIPTLAQLGALADLVPSSAFRAALPLAPVALGLVAVLVLMLARGAPRVGQGH